MLFHVVVPSAVEVAGQCGPGQSCLSTLAVLACSEACSLHATLACHVVVAEDTGLASCCAEREIEREKERGRGRQRRRQGHGP
eukprot:3650919-Amphidinium_carterae.2